MKKWWILLGCGAAVAYFAGRRYEFNRQLGGALSDSVLEQVLEFWGVESGAVDEWDEEDDDGSDCYEVDDDEE